MAKKYWLMKSEPSVYSIDDLERDARTTWEGVRNYQARNLLRDDVKKGDGVLFYHSSAKPMGVSGIAKVCKSAHPDTTAFDKRSKYYDAKSKPQDPTWWMVDVEFVEKFPEVVSLSEIKSAPDLEGMMVAQRGARLSVQPVSAEHFRLIRKMGRKRSKV